MYRALLRDDEKGVDKIIDLRGKVTTGPTFEVLDCSFSAGIGARYASLRGYGSGVVEAANKVPANLKRVR